jgi:hypothetical protein
MQNSQSFVEVGTSSLAGASGTDLVLNLTLGLKANYPRPQNVYLWVKDFEGHDTGWVQTGTWTVATQMPVVAGGAPANPTAASQTFQFTARDGDGYANIRYVYFLVNPTASIPHNSCHGFYDRSSNSVALYNDTLSALVGFHVLGTPVTMQNSRCFVDVGTSSLAGASGTDLVVNLTLGLKAGYPRPQKVYVWVKDLEGHDTGWMQTAIWGLP